jgi:predicted SprT family Zn-dependent metalloprotease
MAPTRAADFCFNSDDDELPTLNTLLTRSPNRPEPKYSLPKLLHSFEKSRTTTIRSREQRKNSDIKKPGIEVIDLISDSEDSENTKPKRVIPAFTGKEIRRTREPSLDQADDGIFGEETARRRKGSFINSRKLGTGEHGLQSRLRKYDSDCVASRKESTGSVRGIQGSQELSDESLFTNNGGSKFAFSNSSDSTSRLSRSRSQSLTNDGLSDTDEEPLARHPPNRRNRPLRRLQTEGLDSQRRSSENKGRQDIIHPFSHLQLDLEESLDRDRLRDLPIVSPRKYKQKASRLRDEGSHIDFLRELDFDIARDLESDDDDLPEQQTPRKPTATQFNGSKTSSPKKQYKKAFDAKKDQLATDFLQQLDARITDGKIGEMTESTGGVKIVWSKTLKTTAGRASWKRETMSSKQTKDGISVEVKEYRHHSSIELAEKVIDDEQRLLNVIAHEFCHLANFMINGIKDNPHGKEFKVWAAKCSKMFASQGIKVTTKHTYEIDFKYVWTCTACSCEYKRHSKSIDPTRHRCGSCKAVLEQTKPAPRQASTAGKLSDYQLFVKEQMKIVRIENPDCQQKDMMKVIADKWAKAKTSTN